MSHEPSHRRFEAILAPDESWTIFDRITGAPVEAGDEVFIGLGRQTSLIVERRLNLAETPAPDWQKIPSGQIDRQTWIKAWWMQSPKKLLALLALFLGIAMAMTPAARGETQSSPVPPHLIQISDRAAIEGLFTAWEAAWASHDMKAFAALYHEDCVFIAWTGAKWLGRDAVEKGHAEVHKTFFRNSIQRKRIDGVRFLAPDVALVHLWSTLTGDERQPDKVVRSRNTLVLTKHDGAWRILSFQNTRLADNVPD
jgi:uncharacterized protein (TIGR02246 family)